MGDFGRLHSQEALFYTAEIDNKPLHQVTLDSFSISAYKASYADFDTYTAATGQPKVGMQELDAKIRLPNSPAGVNWSEARHYCQWLGNQIGMPMDLPTEAQWEYAARSGGKLHLYGTNTGTIENGVNVWSYDQREAFRQRYHTIANIPYLGQFPPNPLGLYDIVTDNYEWVLDWYHPDYYVDSPEDNPKGPATGTKKVLRGARAQAGDNLMMGNGMVFGRSQEFPNVAAVKSKERLLQFNPNRKNSARCVANSSTPISTA